MITYHTKSLFLSVNVFEKVLNIGGFILTFRFGVRFELEVDAALRKTDGAAGPVFGAWPCCAEVVVGVLLVLETVAGEDIIWIQLLLQAAHSFDVVM